MASCQQFIIRPGHRDVLEATPLGRLTPALPYTGLRVVPRP
jgi:hypothetical protein